MSITSPDWNLAACRRADPSLFFAPEVEHPDVREARETKARGVCRDCPVTVPCLDFRLSFERQRDDGIWGGKDGDERAALRHALVKRLQRRAA